MRELGNGDNVTFSNDASRLSFKNNNKRNNIYKTGDTDTVFVEREIAFKWLKTQLLFVKYLIDGRVRGRL